MRQAFAEMNQFSLKLNPLTLDSMRQILLSFLNDMECKIYFWKLFLLLRTHITYMHIYSRYQFEETKTLKRRRY